MLGIFCIKNVFLWFYHILTANHIPDQAALSLSPGGNRGEIGQDNYRGELFYQTLTILHHKVR